MSRKGLRGVLGRLSRSVQNGLEIARMGRLSEPYAADFEVRHSDRVFRLRHYAGAESGPPILLVPPLMVASEVYDMAPDISAVRVLLEHGVDVWICDFGAPEEEEGGMERTLDDHVRAVSKAIEKVAAIQERDVHLAGYSQGGMFCYQAAALRRSDRIASVITFGSPVDIHRNVPGPAGIAEQLVGGLERVVERPLEHIEGLPGFFTSTGFKLFAVRKEVAQLLDFVVKLHDRQALERRESRRRFLGGEGFVSWPGPALRKFVDEFIVHNRMLSGGFVIDGRTVSLADITSPVLFFVGERDDIARPASVRAVRKAVVAADLYEVGVHAGHFGIVVGSRSLAVTWPTVSEWIHWLEGEGPRPSRLPEDLPSEEAEDAAFDEIELDLGLLFDAAQDTLQTLARRVTRRIEETSDSAKNLRYQLPRLGQLERMDATTRVGMAKALAERAGETPDQTFFLWKGRAFTYRDADRRVGYVAKGLVSLGVRHGDRVGVWMRTRPSLTTTIAALNRIGAVAALLDPACDDDELAAAMEAGDLRRVVVDPDHAERARAEGREVWVLGGGPDRELPVEGVVDMEQIDPDAVVMPADVAFDAGRARDLAMILFSRRQGRLRAARITNGRWAFSALGTAAAATLTEDDTVYSALPLHHASGILVATGSALVGGSRLALSSCDLRDGDPAELWGEVRRYGATVVYYAGEMCRPLVNAPYAAGESNNPVRLFAGSGMKPEVWRKLVDRFDVGVLEFYASTEATAVLANASGEKLGALGRPLPGTSPMELVAYDFARGELRRDAQGLLVRARDGEPGVLLSLVEETHPSAVLDPRYEDPSDARMRRNCFAPGDLWFVTGDVLRRDGDGDHFFLGRVVDVVMRDGAPVFLRPVEDALDALEGVRWCVAWREGERIVAAVVADRLDPAELERVDIAADEVRIVDEIPLTVGYRPRRRGVAAARPRAVLQRDGSRWVLREGADHARAEE